MQAKACMKDLVSVLFGGDYSRWFETEAGLRQVCPLSPVLSSENMMEGFGWEKVRNGVVGYCIQMVLCC